MTDSEHIRTLHIQGAQWLYIDAQNGTASRFTAWHGGLDAVQQSRVVRLDDKNVVLESAKNSSVKQSAAPSISALLAQLTALHALDAHSVVFGTRAGQLVLLHLATSKKGRHRAVVLSGQHSSAVTWISHVASTLYSGDEHGGVSESHVTADQLRADRTLITADTASRASVTLVSALHGAAQLAVVRGRKLKVNAPGTLVRGDTDTVHRCGTRRATTTSPRRTRATTRGGPVPRPPSRTSQCTASGSASRPNNVTCNCCTCATTWC
jgi:hypothetical protein